MDIRIVDGRLVKDAEIRKNKQGSEYLTFGIANNSFSNGEQVTTFFNVISYDNFLVQKHKNDNFFSKGKLVVVSGRPTESMVVRNNQTYLNRNIIASSVELGTLSSKRDDNATENSAQRYHSVAPVPTCEAPTVSQPQAPVVESPAAPAVSATPKTEAPSPVKVEAPVVSQTVTNTYNDVPNVEDDLPF